MIEGYTCQWLSYKQLLQRFKIDKIIFDCEHSKTKSEIELYTNDKLWLKFHFRI